LQVAGGLVNEDAGGRKILVDARDVACIKVAGIERVGVLNYRDR
jgi:hypothetical protein